MTHSLLATFNDESRLSNIALKSDRGSGDSECVAGDKDRYVACRSTLGRPSCRKCISSRPTDVPLYFNSSLLVGTKRPITVASTFSIVASACSRGHLYSGTARTSRSGAALIQISVYERASYFSGAVSSHTSAPISAPISPTALEKPPAPQSVTALYSPSSRAVSSTSSTIFSVMALPICTAPPLVFSLSCVSSTLENVAP